MVHPTVRLVVWGVALALVHGLPPDWLAFVCAVCLLAGAWLAGGRLGLLLKRTRWLIASLLLLFAFATPGVYLLPLLGKLGPTAEGLWLGAEHLMRLLFVLASLAVMLRFTGTEGLVAGLHGLMWPLSWLGIDRARVALRLMLVMHYVEQSPPGRRWQEWLSGDPAPVDPVKLRLQARRLGLVDFAVLAGLTFVVAAFLWKVS